MRTTRTRAARRLWSATAVVLALGLAPPAASANEPVKLRFQKNCPVLECTGSLVSPSGMPILNSSLSTVLTPVWGGGDVFQYSAVETVASPEGTIRMRLLGILDSSFEPDVTWVIGTVESGSWRGRQLAGAAIAVQATRTFANTFRGVIRVWPAR
jgi:hypothetical protein